MTTQPLLLDAPPKPRRKRGEKAPTNRVAGDVYITPDFMTHHLVDALSEVGYSLHGRRLFEPCVGTGAIVRVINERTSGYTAPRWYTNDIDRRFIAERHEDATAAAAWRDVDSDAVITNPPFALAEKIIPLALRAAPVVVALLRISWLECTGGRQWLERRPPSSIIGLRRWSFDHSGEVDNVIAAWFIWGVTLDPPIQSRPGLGRFAGELLPANEGSLI